MAAAKSPHINNLHSAACLESHTHTRTRTKSNLINNLQDPQLYGWFGISALERRYVQWKHWGHQPVVVIWLQSGVSGRGQISLWEMQSVSCSFTISLTHTQHSGAIWRAQPSLALAEFCWHSLGDALLFYLFCWTEKCNIARLRNISGDSYRKSTHQRQNKNNPAPKAFCISLRELSRTVITR